METTDLSQQKPRLYRHDELDRVSTIRNRSATLVDYGYDGNGNPSTIYNYENLQSPVTNYGYDRLNRLLTKRVRRPTGSAARSGGYEHP